MRLTHRILGDEELYFLCATSSGVAHRGIVVAVKEDIYDQISTDIKHGVSCDFYGEIRGLDRENTVPIYTYKEIPRLYLYAHHLDNIDLASETLDVTASVTFDGTVDNKEGIYFTYSHFDPKSLDSITEIVLDG